MTKRGIVLISPGHSLARQQFVLVNKPDLIDRFLRRYCIYWDEIDIPENNLVATRLTPGGQLLQEAGAVKRSKIVLTGTVSDIGEAVLAAHLCALDHNNRMEPGAWSLATEGASLHFPAFAMERRMVLQVTLHSALPVPDDDIPFDRLLEFRRRRSDELLNLRTSLDDLYLKIAEQSDVQRALHAAQASIERALRDLQVAASESIGARLLGAVKIDWNLPRAMIWAAAAESIAPMMGATPGVGAAICAMASAISLDLKLDRFARVPAQSRDFMYCYDVQTKLTG